MKYDRVWVYVALALCSVHDGAEAYEYRTAGPKKKSEPKDDPQSIQDLIQEIQSVERDIEDLKLRLEQESDKTVKAQLHRTLILFIERLSLLQKKLYDLQGKEVPVAYTRPIPPLEYLDWNPESKRLASPQNDEPLMIHVSHEINHKITRLREALMKTQANVSSLSDKHDIDRANANVKRLRAELERIETQYASK